MFKLLLLLCVMFTLSAQAREDRGAHKTKVWCAISTKASAQDCVKRIAVAMPTENDDNAAFLTSTKRSKQLLQLIMNDYITDFKQDLVSSIDYIGIVVQNDDEASIYYYAINRGKSQPKLIGQSLPVADIAWDMCGKKAFDIVKKVKGLLLGLDRNKSLVGRVWFDDTDKESACY